MTCASLATAPASEDRPARGWMWAARLALSRLRRTPALWSMVGGIVTFAFANAVVFFTVTRHRRAFEPCLPWMAGLGRATTLRRLSLSP